MNKLKTLTLGLVLGAMALPASAQYIKGCSDELQEEMHEPVALYTNYWKQYSDSKDERYLNEAYPYWKTVVEKCPTNSKNLYIRGVTILKYRYAQATTAAERESILEELMALYDKRISIYGDAPKLMAMKAMDVESLLGADGLETYYKLYADAVQAEGRLDAAYLVKYMTATINYVRAGFAEPTLVVDNYDVASDMLEAELQLNADDSAKSAEIRSYIASVEAAFSPYASCDQLVEIYGKKFEADPENVELLTKITGIMMRKHCTEQDLFFRATENLHRLAPTPATAMRMAQMCNSDKKKEYSRAISYLKDAVDLLEGKDKYNAYMQMGIAYYNLKQYTAARTAFQNAASADVTKGEPYRMIAILYGSSTASATEDNISGRSVYWAAVDALRQSKQVDPSPENVEACDKAIATYSAHYPKQADAFMAGLENGKSFRVPGWIGVVTTVRTR